MDSAQTEFSHWLTAAQPLLYKYIHALTYDHVATQDILQQTNLTIWERMHQFQPGTNFNAWATTVAHYQILTWRKKERRNRHVPGDQLFQLMSTELSSNHGTSDYNDLHKNDIQDQKLEALKACLQKLPLQHQEYLNQRYQQGDSVKEIAHRLHKSENAISQLLVRIKSSLAECINLKMKTNK